MKNMVNKATNARRALFNKGTAVLRLIVAAKIWEKNQKRETIKTRDDDQRVGGKPEHIQFAIKKVTIN